MTEFEEFRRAYADELEHLPTTPLGIPTLRWLLYKAQNKEITAEEFIKLGKMRGKIIAEYPLDTSKK